MLMSLPKQNEAIEYTTISANSVKNLKLIGWLLVIGNLITLLLLIILEFRFVDIALRYSFITFMYVTSLICAIFALKDNSNILLYPILVTTIAFVVISLSTWLFLLFNKFYCSHFKNLHPLFTYHGQMAVPNTLSLCQIHWDISVLQSASLLLVAFEKLLEFVVFRLLMKIFEHQCSNAHFCVTEINKAFSTRNDTDDEIIVYERVRRKCQAFTDDCGVKPTPCYLDSVQIQ